MKTTNYLISKQLAEAGFSEQVGFLDYYFNTDKELRHRDQESYSENTRVDCFSYDLETILEALPRGLRVDGKYWELGLHFREFGKSISYNDGSIAVYLEENESLADTVAKMWLKLKENNLI